MISRGIRLFGFLALALAATLTEAAVMRLDDSASPRSRVPAQVILGDNGRPFAQARGSSSITLKFGTVDYRLETAAFVGRRARIFYVVAPFVPGLSSPDALRIDWRGLNGFASGSARPGERTLVWSGVVNSAWLNESLEVTMRLDPRQYRPRRQTPFAVDSYFEIETLP
jgi:hypothetical protein